MEAEILVCCSTAGDYRDREGKAMEGVENKDENFKIKALLD